MAMSLLKRLVREKKTEEGRRKKGSRVVHGRMGIYFVKYFHHHLAL